MDNVHQAFTAALRKVPAIVVGILKDGEAEVVALGTVADEPDPATLCWEIGSITKVFTSILLTDMSIRGEVKLRTRSAFTSPTRWPDGSPPHTCSRP